MSPCKRLSVGFLASLLMILGCAIAPAQDNQPTYTAANIWYEDPDDISSVNYKKGQMIPAGTKVAYLEIVAKTPEGRDIRPRIVFERADTGQTFTLHFHEKYFPDLTVESFRDKYFSGFDFDALTRGMTEREVESIREGIVRPGMSRKAVLVSYGLPPSHRTRSLKQDVWTYWSSRFRTEKIHFGQDGKTTAR